MPDMLEANAEEIFASARHGANYWAQTSLAHRQRTLLAWADQIMRQEAAAVASISSETKKSESDAQLEVQLALVQLMWIARNLTKALKREQRPAGLLLFNQQAHINYQPRGVVLVIGPWNYPIYTPMGQIAGALAAGNSVIFKPSEFTPAAAEFLARTFALASGSDQILIAATGDGEMGRALIAQSPDFICFTGSTATGKKIAAAAAENLIPHILECGGKDAAIITADADLPRAVREICWSAFSNHGQSCIATERLIVEEKVLPKVRELLVKECAKIRAGRDYGPATTPAQHQIVVNQIKQAIAEGATLLSGDDSKLADAALAPFLFEGLAADAQINQDESFGPILTIIPAADRSEAITLANQTKYGLAAAVYAGKGGQAIARQLEVGMVSINGVFSFTGAAAMPFGGVKASGYGRVHGIEGIRAFANPQSQLRLRFSPPITFTKFRRPAASGKILQLILSLELKLTKLISRRIS